MKTIIATVVAALWLCCVHATTADTFGSGSNTFDIEFVTIGSPGNAADTTGSPNPAGSVAYEYRIGKFEISEEMIDKANTLDALGITHDNRGANKPASSISWFEAAKFVNWLNTSEGHSPAYKFNGSTFELWQFGDAGYDPNNLFRNSQARYFLPSVDEWYKAAYYNAGDGTYYDFPTGSNIMPTAVASGTGVGTAVYGQAYPPTGPADITQAGGLSPYGTMGQGGNVWEWEETEIDLVNDSTSSGRAIRGGEWVGPYVNLLSTDRFTADPTLEVEFIGFRVASVVPEPTTSALALAATLFFVGRRCFH